MNSTSMNKDTITVHAMFPISHHQTHPSQTASRVDNTDTALLDRGRSITRAGCGTTGWRTHNTASTRDCLLKNAFTYLFPPPSVSTTAGILSSSVKEWNTCPLKSEIFFTTDLSHFETFPVNDKNQHQLHVKLNVDVGPLDGLIPLPHYIPDAQTASPRSPPDIRPSFAPIPPYTTSSVEDLLSSVYARVAWLIPVRGELPWNDVSRACVVLGHLRVLGTEHLSTNDIVWTHSALRQFWTFLCSCLETETIGTITGPFSLSFHTAPRTACTRLQEGTTSPSSPYHVVNKETEMTTDDPEPLMPIVSASKPGLKDMDYMKVYCDAPWAMSVRRVLAQWVYEEDGGAEDTRTMGSIPFLEIAKLALVNERGEGVLVS